MDPVKIAQHLPALVYGGVVILAVIGVLLLTSHINRQYATSRKLHLSYRLWFLVAGCAVALLIAMAALLLIASRNSGLAMVAAIAFNIVASATVIVAGLNVGELPASEAAPS